MLAVMDATWITAQRTGAATALAAKYLARKGSTSAGVIACGVQGRSNMEALACLFPLNRVKAYDHNLEVAQDFADEMSLKLQIPIEVVGSPQKAVEASDLVVTSGPILKHPQPAI